MRYHGFLMTLLLSVACAVSHAQPLEGTTALEERPGWASRMTGGISTHLDSLTKSTAAAREQRWHRDFASAAAYREAVQPNLDRLRKYLGVVDDRETPDLRVDDRWDIPPAAGSGNGYEILRVRWRVFRSVHGEGLLLTPHGSWRATVVLLPDCDWSPEQMAGLAEGVPEEAQLARKLVEQGCRVLAPVLIDRNDSFSGHPEVRMTNQPHREYVYRPAYQMGRHLVGYEVQKVLAAVDWFKARDDLPIGVAGYGEGGLVALYAGALDARIDATLVSGYFQPRESLWQEPIYRNVWGLLTEFGDAELAALVAPRTLVVEASAPPEISGPPPVRDNRRGAAPGAIPTPSIREVRGEVTRARALAGSLGESIALVEKAPHPGTDAALHIFLAPLDVKYEAKPLSPVVRGVVDDAPTRMRRQVEELLEDTAWLVRESPKTRAAFWKDADASSLEGWTASAAWYRDYFAQEVIGSLPPISEAPAAQTRLIYEEPEYRGFEVVLPVYPEVFAYGILLLPRDLREGERRAVVVCQHGLEGHAREVADIHHESHYYHAFGAQLAREGFVVFAPQNPYIGGDDFRVLQRRANPLKLSLFSYIVRQHEQILRWLKSLPFVDGDRMGFYGLSYGGKTAMRVPALLPDYALSICSADFNEWIWKTTSTRSPFSYQFTGEYEMYEFDLGNTFNYAEMSWLIFPRPFMVERGHHDGVAPDEWVAYEYARVRRHYAGFDLAAKTAIEFFEGPHTIHGVGTFAFLRQHLGLNRKE